MGYQKLSRRLTGLYSNYRLNQMKRLPLEVKFKAIGIGASRLTRRIGKLNQRLARMTLGQQKLRY